MVVRGNDACVVLSAKPARMQRHDGTGQMISNNAFFEWRSGRSASAPSRRLRRTTCSNRFAQYKPEQPACAAGRVLHCQRLFPMFHGKNMARTSPPAAWLTYPFGIWQTATDCVEQIERVGWRANPSYPVTSTARK